jgi:hypothetical protein
MTVKGWIGGSAGSPVFGVRVGIPNASRFLRDWKTVELEIDGELHEFPLRDTFWKTCPEFRGAPLKRWLFKHRLAPWEPGKPPTLTLTELSPRRFRLTIPSTHL